MGISRKNIAAALKALAEGFTLMGRLSAIKMAQKENLHQKNLESEKKYDLIQMQREEEIRKEEQQRQKDFQKNERETAKRISDAEWEDIQSRRAYSRFQESLGLQKKEFQWRKDQAAKEKAGARKKSIDDDYADFLRGNENFPPRMLAIFKKRYESELAGKDKAEKVSMDNAFMMWRNMRIDERADYKDKFNLFYDELNQNLQKEAPTSTDMGGLSPSGRGNSTAASNPGIFPGDEYNRHILGSYSNPRGQWQGQAETRIQPQIQQPQQGGQSQGQDIKAALLLKDAQGIPLTPAEQTYLDSLVGFR